VAVSLYDLTVPSYLQTLGAIEGVLSKGAAYCKEKSIDLNDIVETRLAPDMAPFRFQILAAAHHSAGALKGVLAGAFAPPPPSTADYAGLQKLLTEAREAVEKTSASDLNGRAGKDVIFTLGDRKLPFTAEGFLQTFSLPNFFFHATTAYDILRSKGAPIGKRDFLGKMKLKG
jgi:hypothetical protein